MSIRSPPRRDFSSSGDPFGDHVPRVDDADLVGELIGLVEVLGGEHDGRPAGHEPPDRRPHFAPSSRVEAGGGLVQEQDLRRQDEAGGKVEPAAHAARILLHRLASRVRQAELLEQLVGPRPRPSDAEVKEAAEHHQVLAPG